MSPSESAPTQSRAGELDCLDISRGPGPTRRIPQGSCPGKGISRRHWLAPAKSADRSVRRGTPLAGTKD